ncbi:MAG TPA: G1 family glutamic endopeptidase [Streptosporangiaceae bacterium]|nr:G1 family glutamic endopeptidase [Streptosporangiaceae bacterium]
MRRRWGILTAMLTLLAGLTLATGSASASTGTMNISPGGPIHLVTSSATGNASAHGIGHATATSTNWSGYAATTGTYTSVSASWTEPTGTCSGSAKYSSFWVGLDGYNSNSVEQTGSEVDCSGSTPVYYAWYEMFPHPSFSYSNTVRPGDHFNASVTYTGSNHFSLFIQDTTRGWSHTHTGTLAGAPRSSAEVIVEAPSSSSGILPLANFGTVNITGSLANGSALGNAGGVTKITMINNSGQAKDSVSSLSGGENFSATWLRAN